MILAVKTARILSQQYSTTQTLFKRIIRSKIILWEIKISLVWRTDEIVGKDRLQFSIFFNAGMVQLTSDFGRNPLSSDQKKNLFIEKLFINSNIGK